MYRLLVSLIAIGTASRVAIGIPSAIAAQSAKAVLIRFCELDANGGQLTPEGSRTIAALFAAPGSARSGKVGVVSSFKVNRVSSKDGSADDNGTIKYRVEYTLLGVIEPSQAEFSPTPATLLVEPTLFTLKRYGNRVGARPGNHAAASDWLIEGPVPEPNLNVDSAIRYVTELRAKAANDAVRRNADRALAALKRLR